MAEERVLAHNSVTVGPDDAAGTERLARYLLRPPLSLERMSLEADGSVLYQRKARGRFGGAQSTFDAMDFLARLLATVRLRTQFQQPKLHTVRYYGEYSSVARARRRSEQVEDEASTPAIVLPSAAERRRLRRAWAQMIRRIYACRQGETCLACASVGGGEACFASSTRWTR